MAGVYPWSPSLRLLSFSDEPLKPLTIRGEAFPESLDRDAASELRVARAKDDTHATFAKV
jgi:hypothetical protein